MSASHHYEIGVKRWQQGRAPEAIRHLRRSLDLSHSPEAHNNLGILLDQIGQHDDASAHFRQAIAGRPGFAEAHLGLAMSLLIQGDLAAGFSEYEWRLKTPLGRHVPTPRWNGEPLSGETVILHAEQGFGDTIQFCRYATLVAARGGRVVLVVPTSMRRLLASLSGVTKILTETDSHVPTRVLHASLMSLPHLLGTTVDTIPAPPFYLRADPTPWTDVLNGLPGLKVGIVWASNARTAQPHAVAIDNRRSVRLADMAPILSTPGCSFVSLQLGPQAEQLRDLSPALVHDVSGRLQDWADTAALIAGLDLVISVDTAVAHLAGALGKPIWLLNRTDTCWRWLLNRDDSPWYPTMRIYRQTRSGDWRKVIAEVANDLGRLAS